MKVLHIFNALMPSGAETMWNAAAYFLSANGVETHVLSTGVDVGPYADAMKAAGFKVYHIRHSARRLFDLTYSISLYRLIKRESYDVVQIHPEAWRLTNALIAHVAGARVVSTTIHSIFHHKGLHWLRRVVGLRLIQLFGAKIIAIGDSVMENERQFLYRPRLIYNWINMGRFENTGSRPGIRRELEVSDENKVLMLVGNCSEIKNHVFMMRVMKMLPENFILVHVGRECEEVWGERSLAVQLGIMSRVRFLGPRDDVPRLLEAADVFAMCSKLEGLSLACLEALAKGVPSVVSDVDGLRDIAALLPLCMKSKLEESAFAAKIIEVSDWGEDEIQSRRRETKVLLEENFDMKRGVRKYIELWSGK